MLRMTGSFKIVVMIGRVHLLTCMEYVNLNVLSIPIELHGISQFVIGVDYGFLIGHVYDMAFLSFFSFSSRK